MKGRTSPIDYPGIGEKALPWLQEVQKNIKFLLQLKSGQLNI